MPISVDYVRNLRLFDTFKLYNNIQSNLTAKKIIQFSDGEKMRKKRILLLFYFIYLIVNKYCMNITINYNINIRI